MHRSAGFAAPLVASVLLATGAPSTGWATPSPPRASIGALAPDFIAQGSDGRSHHLSDYRGSVVVLEWTSPTCEVTASYYATGKVQSVQRLAATRKIVWLAINTAAPGKPGYLTPQRASHFEGQRGAVVSAFLFDPTGAIGRQYGAKATPSAYIIDAKGRLVYEGAVGEAPNEGANYVQAALDDLKAGKPVTKPFTPQRGCPVEY